MLSAADVDSADAALMSAELASKTARDEADGDGKNARKSAERAALRQNLSLTLARKQAEAAAAAAAAELGKVLQARALAEVDAEASQRSTAALKACVLKKEENESNVQLAADAAAQQALARQQGLSFPEAPLPLRIGESGVILTVDEGGNVVHTDVPMAQAKAPQYAEQAAASAKINAQKLAEMFLAAGAEAEEGVLSVQAALKLMEAQRADQDARRAHGGGGNELPALVLLTSSEEVADAAQPTLSGGQWMHKMLDTPEMYADLCC